MFTGIVEEIGKIKDFSKKANGARITVECKNILEGTKIGDSIAINGCCQTVTDLTNTTFSADVSDETLRVTTFKEIHTGDEVNLERALTPSSRMGGHIVQGHIDCIGKFLGYERLTDFYNLTFTVPETETKYIVKKGSIAINGISLTVADINGSVIKVAVIPHTWQNTTLKDLKSGYNVNIETDILGRYIEKFLSVNNNNRIDENFLRENGFV